MAHRILRDHEADGWERSDFPIICESCLGDNPYVRMVIPRFHLSQTFLDLPVTCFVSMALKSSFRISSLIQSPFSVYWSG